MKKIIHSDDCGLNEESTDAVIKALQNNRINSTSIMMGAQSTNYAAEKLLNISNAIVGLHLNLLEGKCSAPISEVSGLVDRNGFFNLTLGKLWFKTSILNDNSLKQQVLKEASAQAELFRTFFPSRALRLDGHLHVHCIPGLKDVMSDFMSRFNISYVRTPYEINYPVNRSGISFAKCIMRRKILNSWSVGMKKLLIKKNIPTADFFIGTSISTEMDTEYIYNALKIVKNKCEHDCSVEIMLHLSEKRRTSSTDDWYQNSYKKAHFASSRVDEFTMAMSSDFDKIINFD